MPRHRDIFTKPLFINPEDVNPEDDLILTGGKLVDAKGNVSDPKTRNLISEAPSEGLKRARQEHPGLSDRELSELAAFYNRRLESKLNKRKKK